MNVDTCRFKNDWSWSSFLCQRTDFQAAPDPLTRHSWKKQLEYACQSTTKAPIANESAKHALYTLRRLYGLEPASKAGLSKDLVHLLNDRCHPLYEFDVSTDMKHRIFISITEPYLILMAVALQAELTIHLFSSRAPTRVFGCGDRWLALFHNVSSFTGESQFISLWQTKRRWRLPHVTSAPAQSHAASFDEITNIPVIKIREANTKKPRRTCPLDEDCCRKTLAMFFSSYLAQKLQDGIKAQKDVKKKRKMKGDRKGKGKKAMCHKRESNRAANEGSDFDDDSDLDSKIGGGTLDWKSKLKEDIRNASFIRGVYKGCTALAENDVGRLESFEFQYTLRKSNIDYISVWRLFVDENFDSLYETANKEHEDTKEDESDKEKFEEQSIRTVTVPLKSILRADLPNQPLFLRTLDDRAIKITHVISDLSVLARMATFAYASCPTGKSSAISPMFDFHTIFPAGFKWRDQILGKEKKIEVAPLPKNVLDKLKDAESATSKGSADAHKDFLSQRHLQYLYARFLSPGSKATQKDSAKFPSEWLAWSEQRSELPNFWDHPKGWSTTIVTAIKQYSVSLGNHWNGPMFYKLLDHLIRVLLRLHLAPIREEKRGQRVEKEKGTKSIPLRKRRKTRKRRAKGEMKAIALMLQRRLLRAISDCEYKRKFDGCTAALRHFLSEAEAEVDDSAVNSVLDTEVVKPEKLDNESDTEEDGKDDEEDNMDEEMEEKIENQGVEEKDIASRRINILTTLAKRLVQEKNIQGQVSRSHLEKYTLSDVVWEEREVNVTLQIVNAIRPFVPRKDGFQKHPALLAPFAILCNVALRLAGYTKFTWSLCPSILPSAVQMLHIDETSLYELFASKDCPYQVFLDADDPVTSSISARKYPRAMFGSVFDLEKINFICVKHGLNFRNRIETNGYISILEGTVICQNRQPFHSAYDDKNRKTCAPLKKTQTSVDSEKKDKLKELSQTAKQLQNELKLLNTSRRAQHNETCAHKKKYYGSRSQEDYDKLQTSKNLMNEIYLKLIKCRSELNHTRYRQYMTRREECDKRPLEKPKKMSMPTPTLPRCIDDTDNMDISQLKSNIAFSGTDYGVKTMSVTVPITLDRVNEHLKLFNHFSALGSIVDGSHAPIDLNETITSLPKPTVITAKRIDEISFARKHRKQRERLKMLAPAVRDAEAELGKHSLNTAVTKTEVKSSYEVQMDQREILRNFYRKKAVIKKARTQQLRTSRAYDIVTAQERAFVVEATGKSKNLVMCIGTGGTGVGSRITGHSRRGGKKLRIAHARHTTVSMTNEFRSSKTCVFCFQPLELAKATRVVKGSAKVVSLHGSVRCINPLCPAVQQGRATRNRDAQAALAIGLAGAVCLLSDKKTTLPPFNPQFATNTASYFRLDTTNTIRAIE